MRRLFGNRARAAKPDATARLEAEHGKALAWGGTTTGLAVLATSQALIVGADPVLVLPWHTIDVGSWDPPTFTIRYRDTSTGSSNRLRLELAELGELPPVVREQVNRTVLVSRRVALQGQLGAVMAARRDGAGAVSWTVVFDPGLDPRDPDLQATARAALADLRQSLGA